jgi:hypothetical protein
MFYPSVYTHTIPWALHTKAIAKANPRDYTLIGNRLDFWIRSAQDGQTKGIPIGPDTSFLIAEVLLRAFDDELARKLPVLNGFRAIDDIELAFRTYSDAEYALNVIVGTLDMFELGLNPRKTKIVDLPHPIQETWSGELRKFSFRSSIGGQRHDLVHYFSRAFELAEQYPEETVLKYAIGRMRGVNVLPANWGVYQSLLFQCGSAEPGTLPLMFEELVRYTQLGHALALVTLGDLLNHQIVEQARVGHASEVAWALWGAVAFGVSLEKAAADAVVQMEDSFVALLALDAEHRGLIPSHLNPTAWATWMTADDLYGDQWLLAYEANVKGWLPAVGGVDHVASDPAFGYLKTHAVSFYDPALAAPVMPSATRPRFSGGTGVSLP